MTTPRSAAPGCTPTWMLPRCQRYVLLHEIGRGGYGSIQRGIDSLTNRKVAIKRQQIGSKSCEREFACLSALAPYPHPNVIVMLDYFVKASVPKELYTVYALVDSTLWHLYKSDLVRERRLSDSRMWSYMRDVMEGLSHMHSLGIVHGDASLVNMLLTDDTVQVADMGSANSAHQFFISDVVSTWYVGAPEATLRVPELSAKIDLWAWGIMTYMMHTGVCDWLTQ